VLNKIIGFIVTAEVMGGVRKTGLLHSWVADSLMRERFEMVEAKSENIRSRGVAIELAGVAARSSTR